ncbi:MAG TPA: hypothetical protein VGO67_13585 [Verrucomicrobiae bacterium]|jgi:hypothetical protein
MKNRKLYSIVAAVGITAAVVLPVAASDNGANVTLQERYAAEAAATPVKGLDSMAAERVDFSQLPAPVKAAVQAQRGNDVITAINSQIQSSRVVYHVQFKGRGDHPRPELVVASDGTILKGKHAKPAKSAEIADVPVNR